MSDSQSVLDVVRTGLEALRGGTPDAPEVALLRARDGRYRRWRRHCQAFLAVNGGMCALNVLIAVTTGITFPFALIPIISWGIGLSLHGMSYASWRSDNAGRILAAEQKLGLSAPAPKALPAPGADVLEVQLGRARKVVARAQEALTDADIDGRSSSELNSVEVCAELDGGLEKLENLVQSGLRVRKLLYEHGDRDSLDAEIAALEQRITQSSAEDVLGALQENRALLLERRARLLALSHELERLEARAEGFILAAENLCLEANRIDDPSGTAELVAAPLKRLKDELKVMRKVEAELNSLRQS